MPSFTEEQWRDAERELTDVLIKRAREARPIAYSDVTHLSSIELDYHDPLLFKPAGGGQK